MTAMPIAIGMKEYPMSANGFAASPMRSGTVQRTTIRTTGMAPAQKTHRNWTRSTERARQYLTNREAIEPMKHAASKPKEAKIVSTVDSVAVQWT